MNCSRNRKKIHQENIQSNKLLKEERIKHYNAFHLKFRIVDFGQIGKKETLDNLRKAENVKKRSNKTARIFKINKI